MKTEDKTLDKKADTSEAFDILYPERFIKNTDYYNSLMMMYRCAIREIRTKLEVLDDEFSITYKRNPISSIKSRIKTPLSTYNKLQRLGYDFTEQNIREHLNDVAGIRVICSFIDDIYSVAKLLSEQDDITILRINDYIQNPKPNFYRRYLLIVEIHFFFAECKTRMRAEIQIRTIGMDFWASLEHQLRYKKDLGSNEQYELISRKLSECAHAITATDNQMQDIKNLIGEYNEF